ncbi:MAG: hypothetical protein OXP12_06455 [Thaumarchaeota archaeon]|nr:hypothetical protein [Nitrososphaerota archaeon]
MGHIGKGSDGRKPRRDAPGPGGQGGEKRENQAYWKARTGCNKRWVVEGVFSMFKRLFGGHLMALKWESIVQEVRLKAILYNKWRDESMEREAGGGTS